MQVMFLREHEVKMSALETKIYPKGWSGEIDDKTAKAAIKAEAAVEVKPMADATIKADGGKADSGKTDASK